MNKNKLSPLIIWHHKWNLFCSILGSSESEWRSSHQKIVSLYLGTEGITLLQLLVLCTPWSIQVFDNIAHNHAQENTCLTGWMIGLTSSSSSSFWPAFLAPFFDGWFTCTISIGFSVISSGWICNSDFNKVKQYWCKLCTLVQQAWRYFDIQL